MSASLKYIVRDFFGLFYPPVCIACSDVLHNQESHICTTCLYNMPRTDFHLYSGNSMEQLFWGRVQIENAAAMYYFEMGSKCRKLLHHIKYKGNKELARYIGSIYGVELSRSGKFDDIDMILPVPLHTSKLKKRGFNQSEWFARGLAEILEKPVFEGLLVKFLGTETQTSKSRIERWENVKDNFRLREPDLIKNRHILLTDDVVTTGATLEACATALLTSRGVKVSILTIAFA